MPANFSLARAYVELGVKGGPLQDQLSKAAASAKEAVQKIQKQVDQIGSAAGRAPPRC